jgi:hypothetical protein
MSDTTNSRDATTPASLPPPGGVDPAAIARGHELDGYDTKSVLSVPLLVVLFFLLAFGSVTIIFSFVSKSVDDPKANPQAVQENSGPLNDRMSRIHRTSGGPTDQPRLEPLRLRTGESRAITRPETDTGNPPELHPEDIRPTKHNTPELFEGGPLHDDKSVVRIPIEDAMRRVLEEAKVRLPVAQLGTAPPGSGHVPSAANAGRGAAESKAEPPKLPEVAMPPKAPEPGVKK